MFVTTSIFTALSEAFANYALTLLATDAQAPRASTRSGSFFNLSTTDSTSFSVLHRSGALRFPDILILMSSGSLLQ